MAVVVFSPVYIDKTSDKERDEALAVLKDFLDGIALQVGSGVIDRFILVDDASDQASQQFFSRLRQGFPWLEIITHHENIGLAQTLVKIYTRLVDELDGEDIIVRLDSDGEHMPSKIPELVARLRAGADGALCQIKYSPEHQDAIDRVFNPSQGHLQGLVVFGRPLEHNCPGFCAYKVSVMKKIMERYPWYEQEYMKRYASPMDWTMDLVVMFLADLQGFRVDLTTFQPSVRKPFNRGMDKVLDQIHTGTNHLKLMLALDPGRKKRLGS
ncbi:TPA: glycosyltransferase family 2 protein [Candidatus Woesearchaeota archaeon]|nr:glycosyltransferase family 2 protein [Candidatus Woesearchaeota archaeon]